MDLILTRIPSAEIEVVLSSQSSIKQAIEDAQVERTLDLEESWSGLHFMLSGEFPVPEYEARRRGISWDANSLENAIMGGKATAYRTVFGPVRYLSPDRVARLAEELSKVSLDDFRAWYDPDELLENRIPPAIWQRPKAFEWLMDRFVQLVDYYHAAAANGDGLLIHVS